jgi:hypothetical protein
VRKKREKKNKKRLNKIERKEREEKKEKKDVLKEFSYQIFIWDSNMSKRRGKQ